MRRTPSVPGAWVTGRMAHYFYRALGPTSPVAADGLPIPLVHGLGVSSAYFARLQPLLATHRRVYAPDLPGFGRTHPHPRHILNAVALAGTLVDWMDALGLPRAHLVGHSLGGPIAVEGARLHPERVARVVLVGPTIGSRGPHAPHQSFGLLRDFLREPPTLVPVLVPDYVRAGIRRIVATDVLADEEDTVGSLARVSAPVLIVRGERDPIVSRGDIGQLRGAAPQARYHEVPGAPHIVQWRHMVQLAALIDAFLDEDAS